MLLLGEHRSYHRTAQPQSETKWRCSRVVNWPLQVQVMLFSRRWSFIWGVRLMLSVRCVEVWCCFWRTAAFLGKKSFLVTWGHRYVYSADFSISTLETVFSKSSGCLPSLSCSLLVTAESCLLAFWQMWLFRLKMQTGGFLYLLHVMRVSAFVCRL